MRFSNRVRMILQKTVPFSFLSGPSVGRMRYASTTGYVRSFEILMQFFNWICMALQKTVSFSSPTGPRGGRIRYAPKNEYVRPFEIPIQFLNWVLMLLQKTVPFSSPSGPLVGRMRYAPTTGYVCPFEIPMQIPQPGMCKGSKNGSVFVLYGAVCGAYSIHPYNRVRAILRNTDAIPQLDTYGSFKKLSRFRSLQDRLWGVFNTPLQPGTCDSSKYRYALTTGYVRSFEIPM